MNLLQNALKELYFSLGGDVAAVRDMEDLNAIILEIAKLNLGASIAAAAELPAVTSDDNNKVLTVSAGKWAAALPASQLPAVTGDDDGKVLTVVDGAWAPADLPAEGEPLQ